MRSLIRRPAAVMLGLAVASLGLAVPNAPLAAAAPAAETPIGAAIYVGDGAGGIRVFDRFGAPLGGFGTGFLGAELAVGDVTGDGIDDVALAGGSTVRTFTRSGTPVGGFATGLTDVAAAAVGDFNGNHVDEIMVVDGAGTVSIAAPGGTPSEFSSGVDDVLTAVAGDFTGAGDTDEVMVMETDGSVRVFTAGTPAGSFETHPDVEHAAAGDVNGDGNDDLIIEVHDGFTRRVAMFSGTGTPLGGFDLGAISGIEGLSAGDADADGAADILIASGDGFTGAVRVLDRSGNSLGSVDTGPGIPSGLAGGVQLDVDVDGIPDSAERFGLLNPDGSTNLDLPALGASPCQKTIAVEIDYMADATHSHIPELWPNGSVDRMRAAFANAPIPAIASCPYPGFPLAQGITLALDVDDSIPEQSVLAMPDGFQDIKSAHFDAVRDAYVHYNVWGHLYDNGHGTDSSGLSNFSDPHDFLLTLDAFGGGNGTTLEQAGTFLHELGHSLGLDHGGNDEVNHKPNYLSVMNYQFQRGLQRTNLTTGAVEDFVDFSREALTNLDAKHLFEDQHLGLSEPLHSEWYDVNGGFQSGRADGNVNWSGTDFDGNGTADDDQNVSVAINQGRCVNDGQDGILTTAASPQDIAVGNRILSGSDLICNTQAGAGDVQDFPVGTEHRFFNGFNDWANLNLRRGFGQGAPIDPDPPVELTAHEAFEDQQAHDQSTAPDRTVLLAPPKPGFHQAVLGVAVDDVNVYATHFYQFQVDPHASSGPGLLMVLDRATLRVKARIPVGFGPKAVAVNPVTHKVYVLNGFEPGVPSVMKINVIDRDLLKVVNTITLVSGQPSSDIEVNSNLNRIYVSNGPAGRIQVIDGTTNQELAPILIGPRPIGMAVDETTNTLHVALNNRVTEPFVTALGSVIDHGASHTILPPVDLGPVGTQPVDVAVDGFNKRIITANLGGGTIHPSASVLDTTTRTVLATIPLARPGRAVTVNPFAHQAFIAGEEHIHVIGTETLTVHRRIPAALPFAIATPASTHRHLYTGDLRSGILTRLAYSSGNP